EAGRQPSGHGPSFIRTASFRAASPDTADDASLLLVRESASRNTPPFGGRAPFPPAPPAQAAVFPRRKLARTLDMAAMAAEDASERRPTHPKEFSRDPKNAAAPASGGPAVRRVRRRRSRQT